MDYMDVLMAAGVDVTEVERRVAREPSLDRVPDKRAPRRLLQPDEGREERFVDIRTAGQQGRCPKCSATVSIPTPSPSGWQSSATPTA